MAYREDHTRENRTRKEQEDYNGEGARDALNHTSLLTYK